MAKLFYLFGQIRPFYSGLHNSFLLVFLTPVYSGFIAGLSKLRMRKSIFFYSITFIAVHSLSIGFMSVDWDGRFLLPMLPLIFIIGVPSLIELVKKIFHKETALKRL
jgi:hypothetical protein